MESWIELQARLSTGEQIRIDSEIVTANMDWVDRQMAQGYIRQGNTIWCPYKHMLIETIQFTTKAGDEAKELGKIKFREWP